MYSIGVDAHKSYSQITIMQENGKIINRYKVNNDRKSIKRALSPYAQEGERLFWSQAGIGDYFTIFSVIVI